LRAAEALDELKTENEDQKVGINIVRKALSWPTRLIAMNAGAVGKILEQSIYSYGSVG
jgi:chaperonin GroEL